MILGITSSIGCGATTVARMFQKLGAKMVSADEIARKVIDQASVKKALVKAFGQEILLKGKTKEIDRKKLAEKAFASKTALGRLNAITHPKIILAAKKQLKALKKLKPKLIVFDAPLLFEAHVEHLVERVLVVKASRETQLKRLMQKGYSEKQARQRISVQLPLSQKILKADFVVNNNGTLNATRKQVKMLWRVLKKIE